MTAALLVFVLWFWDPVVVDCHGDPETVAYYEMQESVAIPVDAWCNGTDENGDPITFWCGWYEIAAHGTVAATPNAIPLLEYEPPVPCLGCVTFNWMIARDMGGNYSGEACP